MKTIIVFGSIFLATSCATQTRVSGELKKPITDGVNLQEVRYEAESNNFYRNGHGVTAILLESDPISNITSYTDSQNDLVKAQVTRAPASGK